MSTETEKIEKIKRIEADFREKFKLLKKTKDSFVKLFRKKLEEKKITEIKQKLSNHS